VWKSVYRFHTRSVDRFGARGLNSGVAGAENAAWKLAFVLHGWAPEASLESYHQERLAAAQENITVTSGTMRFLVRQNDDERRARRRLLEDAAQYQRTGTGRLREARRAVLVRRLRADHHRPATPVRRPPAPGGDANGRARRPDPPAEPPSPKGVRLSIDTGVSFEDFRGRYERAVPSLDMDRLALLVSAQVSWESVVAATAENAPHGFIRYWSSDVGSLMRLAGDSGPVRRI